MLSLQISVRIRQFLFIILFIETKPSSRKVRVSPHHLAAGTTAFADGSDGFIFDDYAPASTGVTYAWDLFLATDVPAGGYFKIVAPVDIAVDAASTLT